jgi:thiamine-monophosphate kinase
MDAVDENRLLSRWAALLPRPAAVVGAVHECDAELVPLGDGRLLAIKVDAVVEEIAAGLYRDPETAGRIAVVSALSDLAAVGADAIGVLLAVDLPAETERVQAAVAAGVSDACREAGVGVLGGDTNEAAQLSVTCVAVGTVPADTVHTRVGLRPGDRVYASGPLGLGAALAAARLLDVAGFTEGDYRPPIRLVEGRALRGIASAAMDTSDGLVATVDQLARINDCAIRIDEPAEALLHPKVQRLRQVLELPAFPFLASHHGEFELVFGVPVEAHDRFDGVRRALGWAAVPVGRVETGEGLRLGERPVDGARIRNLLRETHGDLRAYVAALIDMGFA